MNFCLEHHGERSDEALNVSGQVWIKLVAVNEKSFSRDTRQLFAEVF
jgi:hypothetical protein